MEPLTTKKPPGGHWYFEKYRGQWVITNYAKGERNPDHVIGCEVKAAKRRGYYPVTLTELVDQKRTKKHVWWISRWRFTGETK